ncbi:unnamed protein product [Euphydryas editha]|uniref:Uncharacterized protein n=1 Tax=Euphydryas editha TaxID=104508 RepID=A0AAU9UZI5_EUPED|nr:unnamed protein product [Euphydryas editha]
MEEECYSQYMRSIERSITVNPKYFWSYYKSRTKSAAMPSILKYNNELLNTGEAVYNAFSSFLRSTFLASSTFSPDLSDETAITTPSVSDISSVTVCPKIVEKMLLKLDVSKSAEPDKIPACFPNKMCSIACIPCLSAI